MKKNQIEVGTRVQLTYANLTGTVTEICDRTGKVRVRLDVGGEGWHSLDELRPA